MVIFGTGATSILQSGIRVSPKLPVMRNATLAPSCALYASCAAAWCGCACTRFSDSRDDLPGPRHTGFSPHRSKDLGEEPVYVRLSGAEGGEPSATLALRRGVFDLIPPPNSVRGLYTEVFAQKA
jgi:hypothetical protein